MEKIDYRKDLKELYFPSARQVAIIEVPEMNFVMIDGEGDPNTVPEFQDAMQALYTISYTTKFMLKKGKAGPDYAVPPAEGLWWVEDMEQLSMKDKESWKWTLMIMQPGHITQDVFDRALTEARAKKNINVLENVRFEAFREGLSAQIMYTGPYSAEEPTIEKLHAFIMENGYDFNGKHHEIYLGDPRRTAQEKLKTAIRQPIKKE